MYLCRIASWSWLAIKVLSMALTVLKTVAVASLLAWTNAQTFQRLGACPTFGCIFPPDQWACAFRYRNQTNQLTSITESISLLGSSLIYVLKSTLRSTVAKPMEAFQTQTSPSASQEMAEHNPRLNSSAFQSQLWSGGTSPGMKVGIANILCTCQVTH